jgi:hypothetical protein
VATRNNIANPAEMAATWSPSEVYEAYYFLRLSDLIDPRGEV